AGRGWPGRPRRCRSAGRTAPGWTAKAWAAGSVRAGSRRPAGRWRPPRWPGRDRGPRPRTRLGAGRTRPAPTAPPPAAGTAPAGTTRASSGGSGGLSTRGRAPAASAHYNGWRCVPLSHDGLSMNFHEYQAKQLFADYGIAVPAGRVSRTPEEAVDAATAIGGECWAVRAETHAGGRGRAGGVKLCRSLDVLRDNAKAMLGTKMANYQTAAVELPVDSVLVTR